MNPRLQMIHQGGGKLRDHADGTQEVLPAAHALKDAWEPWWPRRSETRPKVAGRAGTDAVPERSICE